MFSRILFPSVFALSVALSPIVASAGETVGVQPAPLRGGITADSCFVHIDSNQYTVNSTSLPRFYHEIKVGEPCGTGYEVEIRYPEYQNLSTGELKALRKLQKMGQLASDSDVCKDGVTLLPEQVTTGGLNMETRLSVSRKQGYLGVSFSPVVLHKGQWKRILSCQLLVRPRTGAASPVAAPSSVSAAESRWAAKSVLAEGKWVKIRVSDEGIYQLTASDIQKMGFTSLDKVKVYGYGGLLQNEVFAFPSVDERMLQTHTPDDLEEVPTLTTSDGRKLFWAEGTVRYKWNSGTQRYTHIQNHYSNYSYYFLTEGDSPSSVQRLSEISLDEASAILEEVPAVAVYEKDTYSWYCGGRGMFDSHDFSTNSVFSYRLTLPQMSANGTKTVEVRMGASAKGAASPFNISLNGTKLGTFSVKGYDESRASAKAELFTFNRVTTLQSDLSNIFQFTSQSNHSARLDYIRINYPRLLSIVDRPYSFSPQKSGTVALQVRNASGTSHVWRIGQPGSPTAEVPSTLSADGLLTAVTSTPVRRFVCFDESKDYASPEYIGDVANQNLHGQEPVDYIIIVPASGKLVEQAERLLKLHNVRSGLTGRVVRADELYNEFSSGTPDANAYRRYLKMFYDRAGNDEQAVPRFCLLMGKASWDNRLLTSATSKYKADDLLLAFEVDGNATDIGTIYSFCTDDFFGFLDDGEGSDFGFGKLDIALGRMSCLTAEDAERLVDKVEEYLQNTNVGSWKNTIVTLADNGNANQHMSDAEAAANAVERAAPAFDIQRVYWDRYTRTSSATGFTYPQATERLHQLMAEGALIFNYSGHGSPGTISNSQVLKTNDFRKSYASGMPLWVLASCEIYPFDSEEESLAETSLYLANGGSIAFICATRGVYAVKNTVLNRSVTSLLLSPRADGTYNTMGEALQKSKVEMVENGTENTLNKAKYVFFGDPALHLSLPTGRLVLDSINGKAISDGAELTTLPAGSMAVFAGHVCTEGAGDAIDESFKGTVTCTVYDCEENVVCKNNAGEGNITPFEFTERSKKIFQGTSDVEGGKFRFAFTVPRDISYSDRPGRINLYAANTDHSREYHGFSETFCLNGTSSAQADTIPPKVMLYVNNIDNPDYTITDENPVIIADIFDESGINNAGIGLGHDIELVIDDDYTNYVNLKSSFNYDAGSYQKGQIIYPLSGMNRGLHKVSLRVWDVSNNYSITDAHFIVRSDYHSGMHTDGYITSTRNPASTQTSLITYFPENAAEPGLVVYEVYDTRGRIVYKHCLNAEPSARSAIHQWDLCGNDHQPLPDGLYFYRAVINSSNGRFETDAQKIIISR